MANLETSYLGLQINSPVIAGSCGLTNSVDNIKEIEKRGAGAVVLKSIFEEQINIETQKLLNGDKGSIQGWKSTFENIIGQNDYHYEEALQYVQSHAQEHTLSNYLTFIESAKKATHIPIIASINCVSNYEWFYFAKKIQDTGIDAIELNIFILPSSLDGDPAEIEKKYIEIIEQVKKYITIPLSVKIGFYFTALASTVRKISETGVSGVVLFNRSFTPDININKLEFDAHNLFSSEVQYSHILRWTGILSGRVQCDISSSTGIHDSDTVIKMLLAGAQTTQVASVLYKKGFDEIAKINQGIKSWMDYHNFKTIEEFRGKMSLANVENPASYERVQFMKHFSKIE